jgi:putative pyruvate formate lyase activating enzyme
MVGRAVELRGVRSVRTPEPRTGTAHLPRRGRDLAALGRALDAARTHLRRCALCPRACGVDRTRGERGFCGAGLAPRVASFAVHCGEEPPISGTRGSGNVFLSGCNLACRFCQNYPISRLGAGRDLAPEAFAQGLLALARRGVHNLSFVTPTPWTPQILEALLLVRRAGCDLPVVWNCGGYESLPVVRLLAAAVDVWLPDMKYADGRRAWALSRAPRYPAVNRGAVAEMVRLAGPLRIGRDGLARRGVLVRHLALPGGLADTRAVLASLRAIDARVPVSLMYQYFPAHRAVGHPVHGRRLWREEAIAARRALARLGITEGWVQGYD